MSDHQLDLSGILGALRVRWCLVLALTGLVFGLFTAAALLVEPRYEARALVELRQPKSNPTTEEQPLALADDLFATTTEANKLVAEPAVRTVFSRVKADYQQLLARDGGGLGRFVALVRGWLGATSSYDADEWTFQRFRRMLSAEVVRGTRLIEVRYVAPDPAFAARVANAVADQFLRQKEAERAAFRAELADWLDGRLRDLHGRVGAAEQAVANYRAATNLIEMGKEADQARRSPVVEELSTILERLADVKAARADAQERLARLQQNRADPRAIASSAEVVGSDLIRVLVEEETTAQRKLADLGAAYGERHPAIISARADIAELRRKIGQEIDKVLRAAQQAYEAADMAVQRLSDEADKLQRRASAEQWDRVELRELERVADTEADLYATYLRLARQVTDQQSWQPADVALVSAATPPVEPIFPKKRLILPMGLVAGFSFAALVGAGAELRRRHRVFVDPRELERATGLIMLGTVPWVRHERELKPASDYRLAIEAIGLRLRRLLEPSGDPGSIVAVLSSVPDEGKSTLSLALARWFAAAEQRVLLVDADLRRPSIRQLLHDEAAVEVSRGWGFHRLVSDRAAVIDVLAPSDPPAAASALLATLPSLLDTARQTYDVVLVDTPPLLAASDALAVAGSSDQILFPVRWASTSKTSVAFALRELAPDLRAKTRLVFSMVERQGYRAYGAPGAEGYRRSRGRWHDRKLVRGPLHALAPSAEHGGEERC